MADKELEMLKGANRLGSIRDRIPIIVLAAVVLLVGGIATTVSGDWQSGLLFLVMGVLSVLLAAWHFHALRRLRDSDR
jgi:hypothetical protein